MVQPKWPSLTDYLQPPYRRPPDRWRCCSTKEPFVFWIFADKLSESLRMTPIPCRRGSLLLQLRPYGIAGGEGSELRFTRGGRNLVASAKDITQVGGRVQAKRTTIPDVRLGKMNREISVLLVASPAPQMLPGVEGMIGISSLKAHHINFDFGARTLRWD
jgi:hypothetical protein